MQQQARVLTHPALARRRFEAIAGLPEPLLDLVEASLVIDLEEDPRLDVDRHLNDVQRWSDAVRQRIEGSRDVERIVETINRLLFDEEGFLGADGDYYDPRSALLSEALDRHAGLPITLSILYIELSRRAGIEATGVALPGRFLVKFTGPFGVIVVARRAAIEPDETFASATHPAPGRDDPPPLPGRGLRPSPRQARRFHDPLRTARRTRLGPHAALIFRL